MRALYFILACLVSAIFMSITIVWLDVRGYFSTINRYDKETFFLDAVGATFFTFTTLLVFFVFLDVLRSERARE